MFFEFKKLTRLVVIDVIANIICVGVLLLKLIFEYRHMPEFEPYAAFFLYCVVFIGLHSILILAILQKIVKVIMAESVNVKEKIDNLNDKVFG